MLITRSPFFEEQTHLPEATSASSALLKRLDVLLDDDELLEQVRADLARRYHPHAMVTPHWPPDNAADHPVCRWRTSPLPEEPQDSQHVSPEPA